MSDLILFVEDIAQEKFVAGLAYRMAGEAGHKIRIITRSARGGYAKVLGQIQKYASDVESCKTELSDGLLVSVDANCKGFTNRRDEVLKRAGKYAGLVICAIPDPHIERWFLLDSAAFKEAVGYGCRAPDDKCEKERYKKLLNHAVLEAGVEPLLGGIEYADDIVKYLDIQNLADRDASFARFAADFRAWLNRQKAS